MGKLVLYLPDGSTREIALSRERITIGRRADNDVALPFPAVSGEHAAIVTVLADSFLEDLGSTNGTLVNGLPIKKHFLRDRDRIAIGREQLVYYANDDATPEKLPPEALQERRTAADRRTRTHRAEAPDDLADESALREMALDGIERTNPFKSVISDPDAAASPGGDVPGTSQAVDTDRVVEPEFAIRVLTGPSAGREIPIADYDFFLGRVGVAVAVLRHVDHSVRLVPVEGPEAPLVDGHPVGSDGVALSDQDRFRIAGSELAIVRR